MMVGPRQPDLDEQQTAVVARARWLAEMNRGDFCTANYPSSILEALCAMIDPDGTIGAAPANVTPRCEPGGCVPHPDDSCCVVCGHREGL